jgi:hypothetical protein
MLIRSLAAVCVIALPSLAAANPVTAGINLGVTQNKEDGASGIDASDTVGLYGRLGFSKRVSGQLELMKIKTGEGSGVNIRSGTMLLVVDLTSSGRLVPTICAGVGMDSASYQYGSSTDAKHIEGGFGLEYRAEGGLTLGIDLRMGGRSIDQDNKAVPLAGTIDLYTPSGLREGEYRSGRVSLGVRF